MFQPRVKLEFVRRYCAPRDGWLVCVDIDPSEEGRTGVKRQRKDSVERQKGMQTDAPLVRKAFAELRVNVGERIRWCRSHGVPYLEGDPDVVAYHAQMKCCIVAEVEGVSSGQPEQKLYKAIGQIVRTVSNLPPNWSVCPVIVVYGDRISDHLRRASTLAKLGISGVAIKDDPRDDHWLFGSLRWNA